MILNLKGKLTIAERPLVMGIINLTSDSFYAVSRTDSSRLPDVVEKMMSDGADIIDLGACSTRPGSLPVNEEDELSRLVRAVEMIRKNYESAIISVDTYRATVARKCIEAGADIINDISGGDMDGQMFQTVAELKVPYILTHTRGNPQTMQSMTDYTDVTADVFRDLTFKADRLRQMGVCDVIIDPGFGFAKTIDQNFRLLASLSSFKKTECPVLVGISRKSMIYKTLGINAEEALNGTTALNMTALINGADILRVHDVREASQTVKLFEAYKRNIPRKHCISTQDRGKNKEIELI